MDALTYEAVLRGTGLEGLSALERRLWSKVDIVNDDTSCWEWNASRKKGDNEDYGNFNFKDPITGKRMITLSHRVVFYVVHKRLPEVGRHTCDNPPCSRPSHIIDGTQADNIADMDARGRRKVTEDQRGELNPRAVLTEDMVRMARKLYRGGMPFEQIAATLDQGVSPVMFAIRGDTWAHITDVPPVSAAERRSYGGKLTPVQIEEIRTLRAAGEPCATIAKRYGVTPSNISYLTRDKTKPKKERIRVNLADEQVRQIRLLRVQEVPYKDIADRFSISKGLVNHIVNGRAYTHVK
jgi:predicted DNA-binding protein (UPF0251 family)